MNVRSVLVLFRQAKFLDTILRMGFRGGAIVSKFLLTFFITAKMGLADLGFYGLVSSGATLVPALFGLGLNGVISRLVVDTPLKHAMPMMATRLGITIAFHLLSFPTLLIINFALGSPVASNLLMLIGGVLILENISSDAHSALICRHRATLASTLLLIRSGIWPLFFMGLGLLNPHWATMEILLLHWLTSLILVWLILLVFILRNGRWRWIGWQRDWIRKQIRSAWPFYLSDIGYNGSQYLDRYFIGFFLGLEITGIYTFFWSMANAVTTVVFFGITQPAVPKLIRAFRTGTDTFRLAVASVKKEIWLWSISLALIVSVVIPYVIDLLDKPQLQQFQWVFWIIIVGTLLRVASDGLNLVLYSGSKDIWMAGTSIVGMISSALLLVISAPLAGLLGVTLSFLFTAAIIYFLKAHYVRALMRP